MRSDNIVKLAIQGKPIGKLKKERSENKVDGRNAIKLSRLSLEYAIQLKFSRTV